MAKTHVKTGKIYNCYGKSTFNEGVSAGDILIDKQDQSIWVCESVSPVVWIPTASGGLPGPQGPHGEQGIQGVKGDKGDIGQQGIQGASGLDGTAGATGQQGIQGDSGPQGIPGQDGAPGLDGETGPQGLPGNDGIQGPPGADGNDGATGGQGIQGLPGADGNDGAQGIQGIQGNTGAQGIQGVPGGNSYTLVATLANDQATAADTNPVTLTGLVFTYAINSVYRIWFMGRVSPAASTTGCGFQLDLSSAVTDVNVSFFHQLANTGTLSGGSSIADDASAGVSSGMPANAGLYPVIGEGILRTSGNIGTAQLRFRSETTAVTTCKAGMTMVVEKI